MNPRNTAAGSVRQKDPAKTAERSLSIWLYQMGQVTGGPGLHQPLGLAAVACGAWGCRVNPASKTDGRPRRRRGVCGRCAQKHRHSNDYEIDGVVVKVDDLAEQGDLGLYRQEPALGRRLQAAP